MSQTEDSDQDDGFSIFTVEEWESALSSGAYNEFDGSAYWVVDDEETEFDGFGEMPERATHVHFYGK